MNGNRLRADKWILAAFLLLAIACSKDEINSPLVGTWKGVSYTASEAVDENMDGESHADLTEEMDCVSMEAEFSSSGQFSITSSDATYDVQVINGEVVLIPTGCDSTTETGSWSMNETSSVLYLEFEISGKDEAFLVEIQIELSEQRLVMKNLPFSDDGKITYTVEFARK